jgi:leucyl-tRNA synthetase
LRSKILVPANADEKELEQTALSDTKIAGLLQGKTIIKKIIICGKTVNFVIK